MGCDCGAAAHIGQADGLESVMIQQLRIYEIFENNKAAFHARFRDHAARIMQSRYGFRIVAMWETKFGDRTEFAYLLEWPDEAAKTAAWSAFMADTEWSAIKRVTSAEHGVMVGQIEDRLLAPTDYSPAQGRSLLAASA
jgi:NIPSNAP